MRVREMSKRIAIIGAGMAGLAAAQRLKDCGFDITLIEKSRGLGGRMATRLVDDLEFDHGAQYFTATGARFSAMVGKWRAAGHVVTPGMTAPAHAMAAAQFIVGGCQVTALRHDDSGWSIHSADGLVATPGNGRFSVVILGIPAPQAIPLAASAGVAFPELAGVRYAPCWALMLAYAEPLGLPDDRYRPDDDAIAWIARNASKPGRANDKETVVVHAAPDWSRRHLEWSSDAAAGELIARFQSLTGLRTQPYFSTAHRWRYALVEEAAGPALLWNEGARLGACGDWCLGPRVEAAFDSGEALADVIW